MINNANSKNTRVLSDAASSGVNAGLQREVTCLDAWTFDSVTCASAYVSATQKLKAPVQEKFVQGQERL